jgi:L-ascorbate metabolism protein UlaG (beta-lactamase superfamily)
MNILNRVGRMSLLGLALGFGGVMIKRQVQHQQLKANFKRRPVLATNPISLKEPVTIPEASLQFIGTATLIIRYGGFTVLTDPNFTQKGEFVHLGYGIFSERLTDPAISLADLPPIDVGVLSHFHEDHFDKRVQRELPRTFPIVTTPSAARILKRQGFDSVAVGPWQAVTYDNGQTRLKITAMPGLHACGLFSELLPPVMGSMLEFSPIDEDGPTYRIYLSGDTMVHEDLNAIPQVFPEIDVAVLHLGGTRIMGKTVTMDAEHGLELMRLLNAKVTIPVHYNDYTVFQSPLEDFQQLVRENHMDKRVQYVSHGEQVALGKALIEPMEREAFQI